MLGVKITTSVMSILNKEREAKKDEWAKSSLHINYLKQQLSYPSQRAALEEFLWQVITLVNKNESLHLAVKKVTIGKKYSSVFDSKAPSMSAINRLLRNPVIQSDIWRALKLSAPLPTFSARHWYGKLSESAHRPGFEELYVANNVANNDREVKDFFQDIIDNGLLPVANISEFDIVYAAGGRQLAPNFRHPYLGGHWNDPPARYNIPSASK